MGKKGLALPGSRYKLRGIRLLLFETSLCFGRRRKLGSACGREQSHSNPLARNNAEVTSPRLLRLKRVDRERSCFIRALRREAEEHDSALRGQIAAVGEFAEILVER